MYGPVIPGAVVHAHAGEDSGAIQAGLAHGLVGHPEKDAGVGSDVFVGGHAFQGQDDCGHSMAARRPASAPAIAGSGDRSAFPPALIVIGAHIAGAQASLTQVYLFCLTTEAGRHRRHGQCLLVLWGHRIVRAESFLS